MIVYVKSNIHIKIHIKIYINYLMFSPAFTSQSSSGVSHRSFGLEEIATGKWQSTAILKDQTSPHTWKKDSNMLNRWPLWMVCTWWKLTQASCISHCSDIESTEWLGYTIRDRTAKRQYCIILQNWWSQTDVYTEFCPVLEALQEKRLKPQFAELLHPLLRWQNGTHFVAHRT